MSVLGETNADGEETVAVIGSGISGLASAWLLARQGKRVTLFESEETLGGHALTVETKIAGPIDLGFQVCNLTNYPHLFGFFDQLGIDTVESDMSFALSTPTSEWGSRGLGAIFATPGSATSPAHWRMLRDVLAFGRQAPEVLRSPEAWEGVTLGEYLARRRYSSEFVQRYVVPMTAAVWSCSDAQALEFPVVPLIRFWSNHHLLSILERPVWRVVEGRSRAYVAAAAAAIKDVRTGSRVEEVRRVAAGEGGGVAVRVAGEARECRFDAVVLATHSDVSLSLLGDGASAAERAVLGAIRYSSNEVYVHTDASLMPRARATWASWNCIKTERPDEATAAVCVSYWVNLLQNLPAGTPDLFVTLNPPSPPDAAKTVRRVQLAHPLFDGAAVAAQARVGGLQGSGGVYFCGAWCGYGFHEDGIASAVRAVEALCGGGPVVPWEPFSCDAKMGLVPRACLSLFLRFGDAMLSRGGAIRLILPTGADCWLGDRAAPAEQTAVVRVRRASLFQKVVCKSDIGLGEAYMDGDYAGDVFKLLLLLSRSNSGSPSQLRQATAGALGWAGGALHSLFERLERDAHYANSNTEEGSARNISYHYDAGNDFYKLILDETMLYSSAVFTPERAAALAALDAAGKEASLEEAQYEKIDAMIRAAQLRPGEHVLEIGCGWGACGVRMAQVAGVRVTGITISCEQLAEARKRAREANVEHLVTFEFCDYRNVRGQFDKVVSIEMIEAVGHEHLPTFFAAVSRALKPGGLAAIQVITMPDERYEAYCNSHSDFIRTHIFPGGHLPSMGAMTAISSRLGLELHGAADVGDDYAITLRLWRERLTARAQQIEALGYPRRFIRMYEFYFAYCEAGFANQLIHDYQLTFRKSPLPRPLPPPTDAAPTPVDPLTATLLLVWGGLTAALIASKPHMAIVPAALVAVLSACGLLRTFCGLAPFRAAAATAALAATLTAASSAALLIAAMATADLSAAAAPVAVTSRAARAAARAAAKAAAARSAAAAPSSLPDVASAVRRFVELLQRPSPPAPLQAAARAVVGSAAGCNAARAWEAVRHRQLRTDTFEGAASAVFLVVAAAALYHDIALLPIALAQLSEAHALLLRLRMLKRAPEPAATGQPHAPPGGGFGLGLAFLVLRAAPHAALIGATMPRLLAPGVERTAVTWAALLSVSVMVMHDGIVLLSEVRRHLLASRLAHLEGLTAGNHRKSS